MNAIAAKPETFETERVDETMVVTPLVELGELNLQRMEEGTKTVLKLLENPAVVNVVMDFHKIDYYGSSALAFFIRLWNRVRNHKGRMALCNLSDHGREILRTSRLDQFWPVYPSKEEAILAVERWMQPPR
jgi:stage II sporulation protein AA (anti-sigma F factor antagonist)